MHVPSRYVFPTATSALLLAGTLGVCAQTSPMPIVSASQSANESPSGSAVGTGSPSPDQSPDLLAPNLCEDFTIGYRVAFPGNWETNQPSVEVPACRAFSDVGEFDVPDEVPTYVRVFFIPQDGVRPNTPARAVSERQMTVGDQPAIRWEIVDAAEPDTDPVTRVLYVVEIPGAERTADWLLASTTTEQTGDYETNVAVLDWMMERLEFLTNAN